MRAGSSYDLLNIKIATSAALKTFWRSTLVAECVEVNLASPSCGLSRSQQNRLQDLGIYQKTTGWQDAGPYLMPFPSPLEVLRNSFPSEALATPRAKVDPFVSCSCQERVSKAYLYCCSPRRMDGTFRRQLALGKRPRARSERCQRRNVHYGLVHRPQPRCAQDS